MKTTAFLALALAAAASAQATTIALPADGSWQEFTIDNSVAPSYGTDWVDYADGSAVNFSFTIPAGSIGHLTVVDNVFAGDTFTIRNGATVLGTTSSVPVVAFESNPTSVFGFDDALADPAFSRGVFTLAAGNYSISGSLLQSVTLDGQPMNSTTGGLNLTVSAVPEPASIALLLAGLGVVGVLSSRARGN